MKKAIKVLELLLQAAVKSNASSEFVLGIKNSINALKSEIRK